MPSRARAEVSIDDNRLRAALVGEDGMISEWAEKSWARQVVGRAKLLAPVRTGNLRRSIHDEPAVSLTPTRVSVNVVADAEYAVFVHEGLRVDRIYPRTKKALRFEIRGREVFAKSVRVSEKMKRSRPFLRQAAEEVTARL